MNPPDPQREPQSDTAEKKSITKTHEEFAGKEAEPSISKRDYEAKKRERAQTDGPSPNANEDP